MEVYLDIENQKYPTALALGYFDGVDIGHRAVIEKALILGKNMGLKSGIFTFQKSPKSILTGKEDIILTTPEEKKKIFSQMGVEILYMIDFKKIMNLTSEDFFDDILIKMLNVKLLTCGFNYTFGKGGKAGVKELKYMCERAKIRLEVIDAVSDEYGIVSSTRMREDLICK